jgi:hypothetical protein
MKTSMIAVAFAAFAMTGLAHASSNTATNSTEPSAAQLQQWSPAQQSGAQKTRAEVRQELVQAEHDGQLAYLSKLYRGG